MRTVVKAIDITAAPKSLRNLALYSIRLKGVRISHIHRIAPEIKIIDKFITKSLIIDLTVKDFQTST
ncbi:hypothetical protein [Limnofasciculus baicalensis]|uniref:Uncharacterized protein n=1 Tax=Limnofasciculus baicalensis BBK-W-15 TaxID=2699891 RepID=A0AAE3GQN4_9CYAN|nr:hypothetical protein [Limnofasciculus baicalensis]MCP2728151.1 hypothetical protein [Limnofasciculus baicalensis BBK-W-15]